MRAYVLSCLAQTALVVFLSLSAVFAMVRLGGDPVLLFMPMDIQAKDVNEFRQRLGFNDPLPVQYARFVSGALHGDFGESLRYRREARALVLGRLPATLLLAATAVLLTLLVAVPLGVVTAVRRNSLVDHAGTLCTVIGQAVPGFWLGLMLIYVFSVRLHWLPTGGMGSLAQLVMPSVVLAAFFSARIARLTRSTMLEALGEDYVLTARAKGLSEPRVVAKHTLRNSAIPIVELAGPGLWPVDPLASDFAQSLRPPGAPGHPLGTDQLGRDLLARVLYGARVALFIGACTVVVTAVVGGLLGLIAGFVERWPSAALMRLADVQLSFPFILLAMTINAIVGLGLRNIILSLSAAGWVGYARVVRGEGLSVKERDFVQAAAALGVGRARLLFRHVLPNVAPSIIVVASLQFSQFIVAEAAISFLGFGVQPPTPAWGSMLSESRDFLYVAWWLAAFPGAALALTALGVNLVGDWLRDTLDPKLRV